MTPLTNVQDKLLKEIYYTKGIVVGRDKLYRYLQDNKPDSGITLRQVNAWIKNQELSQLHRTVTKRKHVSVVISKKPLAILQLDLIDFINRQSNQFKYILNVIDVHSKFLWNMKLKNKTAPVVLKGFITIFNQIQKSSAHNHFGDIKVVQMDGGSEFVGIQKFLKDNGIRVIISTISQHQGLVERVNQTIKRLIEKLVELKKGSWGNHLVSATKTYNTTLHSSIDMTPTEAIGLKDRTELLKRLTKKIEKSKETQVTEQKSDIVVGDKVRIDVSNRRSGLNNWSRELFTVSKIRKGRNGNTNRYFVEEPTNKKGSKSFTREEILKIDEDNLVLISDITNLRKVPDEPQSVTRLQARGSRTLRSMVRNENN
jgi:hypothetical protein